MEEKGQLYIPAVSFLRETVPQIPLYRRWMAPRPDLVIIKNGKISCPCQESNPHLLGHPAQSILTTLTELSWLIQVQGANLNPCNTKVGFTSSVQNALFTLSHTETDIIDIKEQQNWAQKLSLPSLVMRLLYAD
jgi:hypothetical protein